MSCKNNNRQERFCLLAGGVIIVSMLLHGCDQFSKQENIYNTYTEASASGALAYGLLPKLMPNSSVRIQEMHGRQSNDLLVTFAFAPSDQAGMLAKCSEIAADDLRYPRQFTEWWPQDLRSAAYRSTTYQYYRCTDDGGYLALNPAQSITYFWRL